jgi:outer membrane receptor protein involved in Fe transport
MNRAATQQVGVRAAIGIALFLLTVVFPTCSLAQSSAILTGRVIDPSGAVVARAEVNITNQETGTAVSLVTNNDGVFRSPALAPGTYQIQATASGFKMLTRKDVILHLGDTLGLDFELEIGQSNQSVTVSGAASLLNTEDASLGQTVGVEAVQSLPLVSRRPAALLQLSPTVRYIGDDQISFGAPRYNMGGLGNVNVMFNGAPAGSDRTNVNQQTSNPPVEAIKEARVQANAYSAEYGDDVGSLVLFETKSGANQFHGSLYEYFRNEAMDASNAFSHIKARDRYHVFGGSIGGPIIKNKLFFFTTQEGSKENNPTSTVLTVPTPAMLQGDFSNLRDSSGNVVPIYDPVTHLQFPGNIIPADRISNVAKNLSQYFPAPVAGAGTISGANNLPTSGSTKLDKWAAVMRLDWTPTTSDSFSATGIIDRSTFQQAPLQAWSPFPFASPGVLAATFRTYNLNLGYTRIFSPQMTETARIVYRQQTIFRTPPGVDPNAKYAESLGLKGIPPIMGDLNFPPFNFSGYSSVGLNPAQVQSKPVTELDLMSTTGYLRGKHFFKWGFHGMRSTHNRFVQFQPNGLYNFDQRATAMAGVSGTGNSIASFLLGQVASANIQGQTTPFVYREWYSAFFVEDAWKVTPKFTLNLGLRWDIDFPVTENSNKGNGFDFTAINPVSGTPGVLTYLGRNGVPRGYYDTDWHRFAPRIGFAYQVASGLVVRGGYGIYGSNPDLGIAAPGAPAAGLIEVNNSFSTLDNGLTPAFLLDDGFPPFQVGGQTANPDPAFGSVPLGSSPVLSPTFVDRNWHFGYTENFNLSIQKQLANDFVVEVAGQGVLGRKLPVGDDFNQVPPGLRGIAGNNQLRRPFPQYGSVTDLKASWGTENYYALTVRAEKRFSHGFSILGNYSWSKALGVLGNDDHYNHGISKGPVLFNLANGAFGAPFHAATIAGVYRFPWGPGERYLSSGLAAKILGGWTLGGIVTMRGGLPFSLSSGIDSLNCSCPLSGRLNLVGDLKAVHQTSAHWFNTAAVARPAFGQTGNVRPGILTSPSSKVLNLNLAKSTSLIGERLSATLGAECFNCTNTPARGIPGTTFGTPTFGIISGPVLDGPNANDSGVSGARIMQVSLRFDF